MKVIRYLIPLWIGVFIYTIFTFSFGAKGISAFIQLEAERDREIVNLEVLKSINSELERTRDSLSRNKINFAVHARELGYAAQGEQFIRIIGLGGPQKMMSSPGQVVSPRDPDYTPDRIIRIVSFFVAITAFISMGAYDFLQRLKDR
jgi:cell division protein FtsB